MAKCLLATLLVTMVALAVSADQGFPDGIVRAEVIVSIKRKLSKASTSPKLQILYPMSKYFFLYDSLI